MVNPRLNGRAGQIVITSTAGPMTRYVRTYIHECTLLPNPHFHFHNHYICGCRCVQDSIDMMSILASHKVNELDATMPCLRPFDAKLTNSGKSKGTYCSPCNILHYPSLCYVLPIHFPHLAQFFSRTHCIYAH